MAETDAEKTKKAKAEKHALSEIMKVESGKKLVSEDYYKAIELLRRNNSLKTSEDNYLIRAPRISRKIRTAIFEVYQFERITYGPDLGLKNAARLLRINRILSSYCKGYFWEEDLSVAGILSRVRKYPFFSRDRCKETFGPGIEMNVFDTPELPDLFRDYAEGEWSKMLWDFFAKMSKEKTIPPKVIFIAHCIDDLRVLSWDSKKIKPGHLFFFDEVLAFFGKNHDPNVSAILKELHKKLKKVEGLLSF